jgi:hypothetical protein
LPGDVSQIDDLAESVGRIAGSDPLSCVGTLTRRQGIITFGGNKNLPPKHVEEHSDSPRVIQAIENCEAFREWTGSQPNGSTDRQLLAELQKTTIVGGGDQSFNYAMWYRSGLVALHHESRHAESAVYTAPLVARQIKNDEEIAGKERRKHAGQFACMPNGLLPFRQEGREILDFQLGLCACLAERQRMNHIPSFAWAQGERASPGHFLKSGSDSHY